MKGALSKRVDKAVAAAASLTGKRFGLLVASSLVATSAIVAGAMTGTGDAGALAALVGRKLPIARAPVSAAPAVPSGGGKARRLRARQPRPLPLPNRSRRPLPRRPLPPLPAGTRKGRRAKPRRRRNRRPNRAASATYS